MSLLARQMQIKTARVYHHTTTERPKIKTRSQSRVGKDVEKWELYHTVGEERTAKTELFRALLYVC